MFLSILSLLVGFLSLFVVLLMLFNQNSDRKINVYLIIILFLAGLQRFLNGMEVLGLLDVTYSPLKIKLIAAFFIVPVYYLFFRRLIKSSVNLKKELVHFILPAILVLIDVFSIQYTVSYYFFLIFSIAYFTAVLYLVLGLVKIKKRSLLEKTSYKTIRTWTILMFFITFLLVAFSNYFLFSGADSGMNLNDFYRYSSLLWLVALVYIFKNPVIIFGEQSLLKNIQLNEAQEFLIWSIKPLKSVEERDTVLNNNLATKIDGIILNIKKLQKSNSILSKNTLTPNFISKELKIPRSHVDFIFKYYCHYSMNDFSNLVKINYAVSLINEGYLDKFTIDSLGNKCLFNSRFTFSKNFKKFMGVSVSDYVLANADSGKYTA
ncbi:AraC family transcriptional regulator [Daejeonella sp.]|uniref:helix-turn-helix domain-containing protein n=1 Tax=Daejeonella sp. TaxID=2805397 RepID=UPI0025C13F34|nr:AraC family transcriptional regulator [Daejeonella sp.]